MNHSDEGNRIMIRDILGRIAFSAIIATAPILIGACTPHHDSYIPVGPTIAPTPTHSATLAPPRKTITEDDPNWDCLHQGNHRCGPVWARGHGHHINCMKFNSICLHNLQAGATWTEFGSYDGHKDCAILVGPTSLFACSDGYLTTS